MADGKSASYRTGQENTLNNSQRHDGGEQNRKNASKQAEILQRVRGSMVEPGQPTDMVLFAVAGPPCSDGAAERGRQ